MDNKTKEYREKAETYLVCYYNECEKAEQCLRHLLAEYVPETRRIVESVNAGYVKRHKGRCDYFRSAEPIVMYKGMTVFYHEIPERIAHEIRFTLRKHFGNSTYYRLRNGERLVTPDIYDYIKKVCEDYGWKEELQFDEKLFEVNW